MVLEPRTRVDRDSEKGRAPEARRFPRRDDSDRTGPAMHRNAVVLAVPSRHGLEAARARRAMRCSAWEDVQGQLAGVTMSIRSSRSGCGAGFRTSACGPPGRRPSRRTRSSCTPVDERNDDPKCVQAPRRHGVRSSAASQERTSGRASRRRRWTPRRCCRTDPTIPYARGRRSPARQGPGGRVRPLYSRLPKVLEWRKILLDTVLQGVERGLFVARLRAPQPELSAPGWREAVESESCTDPALELILPEKASAGPAGRRPARARRIAGSLARGFGSEGRSGLRIMDYFGRLAERMRIPMEGYDDVRTIPRCSDEVVREAVGGDAPCMRGTVWITIQALASVWRDPIPYGVYDEDAVLHPKLRFHGRVRRSSWRKPCPANWQVRQGP